MGPLVTTTRDGTAGLEQAIARRVGEARYRLWFATNTKLLWDGVRLTVGVPNRFYQEWLQNTFTAALKAAAGEVFGTPAEVGFVIDPELFQAHRQQQQAADAEPCAPGGLSTEPCAEPCAPGGLSARASTARKSARRIRTLDDFIVGPSCRLAHAAILDLIERPDAAPNPLTLYGPIGVGKTHLLEAACHALGRELGEVAVQLVTAEDFTNRFLQAMRAGQLPQFRRQFRETQALFVDDLHFLANKTATQEEFLHTFETLQRLGRPVAVTCDSHPRLLGALLPELADRLLGGGVWAIDPPDLPTRVAILQSKAARLNRPLPRDVAHFLAEQVRGNVRELEGALHVVQHYSAVHQRPVTLALAREATATLFRHAARAVQLKDVERALCDVLGIDDRTLHSKSRARAVSHPRMVAMYLARKHTGAPYSTIGRFFGGRNHSTAIAAEKKVRGWLERDEPLQLGDQCWPLRELIERAERELRASVTGSTTR
jgi:chromosomal replication initiator protein